MFTIKYAFVKLRKINETIAKFENKDMDAHQKEYVEHLKNLRAAYEREFERTKLRKLTKKRGYVL